MAITAFTSTAIIDATTIGTTVLTASSEGIAADAIGLGTTDDVTFNSVGCVDGSFTGSLTSEVGGSYKLYNLGAEGDTDTEYYEASWDSNNLKMYAKATGAGVVRNIQFGSSSVQIDAKDATDQIVFRTGGTYRMQINNAAVVSTVNIQPSANGTLSNGSSGLRWSGVYSVDGDFSGDVVMAANVDFTGLPTADPLVASRLWNDSGTMKVSAG